MGFLKRICLKRISAAGEKTSPGLLRRGVREMVRSYKGPDSRRGDVLILFEMDYAQIASALYGLRRKEMYRDYMEICGSTERPACWPVLLKKPCGSLQSWKKRPVIWTDRITVFSSEPGTVWQEPDRDWAGMKKPCGT